MRIVHLAAEFAPIAKAGGLGEVIVGLNRELTYLNEEVEVIIPKYDFIDLKALPELRMEVPDFKSFEGGNLHPNTMWASQVHGCSLHLLEARHPAGYFHRGKIYGCEDDAARFIYFSRAALEYLKFKNQPIDILHLHDWHVSLCAPLLRDLFASELKVKAIVLSIHNGEYQGKCAPHNLDAIGLDGAAYLSKDKLLDEVPTLPKTINLLKGGLIYSDALVAVSPSYSKELLTPEMGFHLESVYRKNKGKLSGILNGIDATIWNPGTDPHLSTLYNSESSMAAIQKAKQSMQAALSKKFSLSPNRPWVGAITRLVPQKGPELIEEAIQRTVALGGVFILLGSSPMPQLQTHFDKLKVHYAGNKQVFLDYKYDDGLAHQLYAALDFVLVPSHFEPCGLTQLIAMRYGAVPIVRSTGGLKDTVFDVEDSTTPAQMRNGFTFPKATSESMDAALKRAIHLFHSDPATFQSIIRRCMKLDSSWKKPAQEYLKLYRKLVAAAIPQKLTVSA